MAYLASGLPPVKVIRDTARLSNCLYQEQLKGNNMKGGCPGWRAEWKGLQIALKGMEQTADLS
jgi:hypothetical protein